MVGISWLYVYAVGFNWYLISMSVRSCVLGVGFLIYVLRMINESCVV